MRDERYWAVYNLLYALRKNRPMDEIKALEAVVGDVVAIYSDEFVWHYHNAVAGTGNLALLASDMARTVADVEKY